jgi:SAM-dependent methyltransferase
MMAASATWVFEPEAHSMHGTNADISDLVSGARPLPDSSLDLLQCPRCAHAIRYQSFGEGYGIASCACGDMPLAEDVLLTDPSPQRDLAALALRNGNRAPARRLVLGKHATRVRAMEMLGLRVDFRRYIRHHLLGQMVSRTRVLPLLERLGGSGIAKNLSAAALFNVYMRHRYCAPGLVSVLPLLGILRDRPGAVLDAPCGMGHLSWALSKVMPAEQIVCMDLFPSFVYSTRHFFVPQAKLALAGDMSRPLPLADGRFGAIFCLDGFQYIPNKARVADEFMRVLRDDGVVVIAHAQNRLHANRYGGEALSPQEYAALFARHHARAYPEQYLVDAHARGQGVDLSRRFTFDELNRHACVTIIAAKSDLVFSTVPQVSSVTNGNGTNLRLSPIYTARRDGQTWVLERRLPKGLTDEYCRYLSILPVRVTVPAEQIDQTNGHLHFTKPAELLRRQVLVELPEKY